MKKTILLLTGFVALNFYNQAQTVSDIDGNVYTTITIGSQTWLAGNLKTTKFNDGTAIPLVTGVTAWTALTTPGMCTYNNSTDTKTINTYGRLYNWYTVNTGNLCPTGWHVPTDAEWSTLTTYLGGESVAGGKLKESGTTHWTSPNTGADNSSGFTALPGGIRIGNGTFDLMGYYGSWWSSSEVNKTRAWHRYVGYTDRFVSRTVNDSCEGLSVRCLRNNATFINNNISEVIDLYPNPSNEKLFIKNLNSINSIIIFNLQGEQILNNQNVINFLNISSLENGVYIIKILDSGKVRMTKFIKE